MKEEELEALLILQATPNLGDASLKKLIHQFGSAQAVLDQSKNKLLSIDGIGAQKLSALGCKEAVAFAKAELQFIQSQKIQCTAFYEETYPEKLKHCIDGPVLLFSRGTINWNNPRILSIVGTRKSTRYGKKILEEFLEALAPLDPLIISGFAYGTDITAHRTCLSLGLQNVGVLAHGLNQWYPRAHQKYAAAIEAHGGFVTDFLSSDAFVHTNFLRRNRIIAGLSEATLVIESAETGGSLVTADLANGYHREVLAVPGRTEDAMSAGCNQLIKKQKAHLVTSAGDIQYVLNWDLENIQAAPVQKQLFVELTEPEQRVYQHLESLRQDAIDHIAIHCQLPTHKTAALLLQLEMKGVVRALPGKQFELL